MLKVAVLPDPNYFLEARQHELDIERMMERLILDAVHSMRGSIVTY